VAWSSAALSADETAWAAADKPLVLGENLARSAQSINWRDTLTVVTSNNDASYPTSRVHDGYTDLMSRPGSAGATWRYVVFDFGAGGVEFDAVMVMNYEDRSGGGSTITVEIADDDVWTVNPATIASYALPLGDEAGRVVLIDLQHAGGVPLRYSGVRYAAIGMRDTGGINPQMGEIIFARRRQLKTNPFGAWDPGHLRTRAVVTTSPSGIKTVHVRSKGERILRATMRPHETDRIDDLLALWEADTDYGTYPFVWIDQPTTAPERAALMRWDMLERTSMYLGPYQREIPIQASEQGPHYVELDP
jgi:hypothetical protein